MITAGLTRVDFRIRFGETVVPDKVAEQTHFSSFRNPLDPVALPPTLELDWRAAP